MGNGQKILFRSWKVFSGCLVAVAMLLLSLMEKNFSACEKFFLAHSDLLLWPQSIWLRVRVAQCAMALRVMGKVFSPQDLKGALPLRPDNQKKLFSLWKVFFSHISSATAFGWGLGSIALAACHGFASECWCNHTWERYPLWTLPQHSQSHGKPLVQCSLARSQTQWPKKYAKKTFHRLIFFFWLSGRSGNAPFKSGGEKTVQPAKSFFSHIQTYCCGPTAFGWGLGWLNAPWLCEWWCSYTWDGHGMVMGVSTGNIPKGGSRYQVWLHQHSQSHGKPLVQCSLARSQTQWPKKYAKKTFHRLKSFFWLSGRSGNAPFKSCG